MSLTIAMQSAISSMNANQLLLQITSANVSNANTPGYTRKSADLSTNILNGMGAGVITGNITRNVDANLQVQLRQQISGSGQYDTLKSYYDQMQNLFGNVGDNSSLVSTLTNFSNALQALAINPENVSQQSNTLTSAQEVVQQLGSMGKQLQSLRTQADADIKTSIDDINSQLKKIDELNAQIAHNLALNQPAGDLQDQRDTAIDDIAKQMDISYFTQGDGQVVIFTKGGRTLLDQDPQYLSYSPASGLTANVTHADGGINGIMLSGNDITDEIGSGRMGALVDLRDSKIPDLVAEMDRLAASLRDNINAISNTGTAYPAPNSLTGSHDFVSGDTLAASGSIRIAAVDSNGKYVDNGSGSPIVGNIDLTALTTAVGGTLTVQNIVDAINGGVIAGFPGIAGVTASLTNGHLVVQANNPAYGVVVASTNVDGSLGTAGAVNSSGVTTGGDITTFPNPTVTLATSGISQAAQDQLTAILSNGNLVLNVQTTAGAPGALQLAPNAKLAFGPVGGGAGSSVGVAVNTASGDISGGGTVEVSIDSNGDGLGDTVLGTITFGAATMAGATAGGPQGSLSITGINMSRDSAVKVGGGTENFAQYFGLNDVFTTGTDYDTYTTTPQLNGTTPLGLNGTLTFSGPWGNTTVNYAAGNTLTNVAASINANAALTAQNIHASVITEGSKVRLKIVDNDGNNFTLTDSGTFLSNLGVGTNGTGILETMQVSPALVNNSALVPRGTLDLSKTPVIGQAGITSGDGSVVQAMANIMNQQISIPAAGAMGVTNATMIGYGSNILSLNAVDAANVTSTQTFKTNLVQNLQTKFQSETGVNIDEELAHMIVYQNAYSASARVIKTASDMFDTLANMV